MITWETWKQEYEQLCKDDFGGPEWELGEQGEINIKKIYYDTGNSPLEAFDMESGAFGFICGY